MSRAVCVNDKVLYFFFLLQLFLALIFLAWVKNYLFQPYSHFDQYSPSKCSSPVNHQHGHWLWLFIPYLLCRKAKGKQTNKQTKRENSVSIFNSFIVTLGGNRTSQIHTPANWSRQRVYISYLRALGYAEKVHISAGL